jgi:hypothetical protein
MGSSTTTRFEVPINGANCVDSGIGYKVKASQLTMTPDIDEREHVRRGNKPHLADEGSFGASGHGLPITPINLSIRS